MTAQQLHNAITGLPEDLVAQADWHRSHPRKRPVVWRKYAALAASFAAVLLCARLVMAPGEKRSADTSTGNASAQIVEAAPAMPAEGATAGEVAPATNTTTTLAGAIAEEASADAQLYPGITLLEVAQAEFSQDSALNTQAPPALRLISREEELPIPLTLPEGWFDSHEVLALFLTDYSDAPQVIQIQKQEEGWELTLSSATQGTEGKSWYILLAADKGLITPESVTLLPQP